MCTVRSHVYGEIREMCCVLRRTHTKLDAQHGTVREVCGVVLRRQPSEENRMASERFERPTTTDDSPLYNALSQEDQSTEFVQLLLRLYPEALGE
jgi:hypothetical protein